MTSGWVTRHDVFLGGQFVKLNDKCDDPELLKHKNEMMIVTKHVDPKPGCVVVLCLDYVVRHVKKEFLDRVDVL